MNTLTGNQLTALRRDLAALIERADDIRWSHDAQEALADALIALNSAAEHLCATRPQESNVAKVTKKSP